MKKETALGLVRKYFPIIAMGSSAGGLGTLKTFFDNCRSDTGFAFIVIQHLSPDYKSLMPELLSRHTDMIVKEAVHGEVIMPNQVYLIPGNRNIILKNGCLELIDRAPLHQINFSIDIFFRSLAIEKKEKAICCIFSGTGTDGTKGAKSIKEAGGAVFVQHPDEAKFDGMPKSAINEGLADFILPVQSIPSEILYFIKYDQLDIDTLRNDSKDSKTLDEILNLIHEATGFNFTHYKKPTLFRRTIKRVNICKKKTLKSYLAYLKKDDEEKSLLAKEYLIGVTKFFRDIEAYDVIEKQVIPNIVNAKKEEDSNIKIWIVACSTGEEAYSIAILLEEYLRENNIKCNYKIFATDINEDAVSIASKGNYQNNIIAEVPENYLQKYFEKTEDGYQISPLIRNNIIFSKHDILHNPPLGKMDLVSCRNMLIYMEQDMQIRALSKIYFGLNKNGYLFLGSSETVHHLDSGLEEVNTKWKVYKNLNSNRILLNHFDDFSSKKSNNNRIFKQNRLKNRATKTIEESINVLLKEELDLIFVCIDEFFEIVKASGKLSEFIEMPKDGFSSNLLKILPDTFSVPIHSCVRELKKEKVKKTERIIKWRKKNELKEMRLVVGQLDHNDPLFNNMYMVIINVIQHTEVLKPNDAVYSEHFDQNARIKELEEILVDTQANLQNSIEEVETTNEEMQATNEELIASNEELQSTNEELQSLNEELHTVNTELHEKNTQLLISNSDIENLIKNVNVGTIFLDKKFHIRKFTPSIKSHFQFRTTDIGRPINHFSGTLGGNDLMQLSNDVMTSLKSHTQEVQNNQGIWFLMQIFPYSNQEDIIQGVVINFININETKVAEQKTAELNTFLSRIIDTNPGVLYIYDSKNRKISYVSENIFKLTGYTDLEINELGLTFFSKIFHSEDIEKLIAHREALFNLTKKGDALSTEYRLIHKTTKKTIWVLATEKVNQKDDKGNAISILGILQDITAAKELDNKLKVSESRLKLAIKGNQAAIWEWTNIYNDNAWWSKEFFELLDFTTRELKPKFSSFLNLVHIEDIGIFKGEIEKIKSELNDFEIEIRVMTKKWGYHWYRVNAKAQSIIDKNVKIVGTLTNIHEKKQAENKLRDLNRELERFAYLASHDLKEPLRTVSSFTSLFRKEYHDVFDENANLYLDFIEKASSRMIKLTNDLLEYSQLDHNSIHYEDVNLNEVITTIRMDLQQRIEEKNADLSSAVLPEIYCDRTQIRQLFQNLIANSLKYTKPGVTPEIHIGFKKKPKGLEFYIKDNGIGIEKKYHDQIFEVFKRLHSQEEYDGTGIGLANCKRIIDNHNGKIWVKSSENLGASFYFLIPKLKTLNKDGKNELYSIN